MIALTLLLLWRHFELLIFYKWLKNKFPYWRRCQIFLTALQEYKDYYNYYKRFLNMILEIRNVELQLMYIHLHEIFDHGFFFLKRSHLVPWLKSKICFYYITNYTEIFKYKVYSAYSAADAELLFFFVKLEKMWNLFLPGLKFSCTHTVHTRTVLKKCPF